MSKISQLTEDTMPTHDDLIETVTDPGGTPLSRKAKLSSLFFVLQQWVFGSDAGSTDTYVVTLSPAPAAYVVGQHYRFKANTANTGACTVNFNSLGAKTIKKAQGGLTTDLADNDIRAGQWVDLVYDGVNFQMQSTLGNAPTGGAGGIGDVVGPGASVDSELAVFNGTTGKIIKRATLTGLVKAISGVIGQADVNDLSSPAYAADAGSNDTYVITLSPAPSGYQTGAHYRFKANTANTGAASLNVNGLGAKTIKKVAGGITTDLADNDIRAGQFVDVVYDGTNFQMQSTLGNVSGVSYPLLAPDGSQGAPSFSFSNGADCGWFLVNGSPDHLKLSVGNKEHLDIYQGTGNKPVVLLNLNNENRLGWGNGSLRSGFTDGGKGSVKAISDENATSGCVYSATADLVDVFGTRRPYHIAGQVFRHVLTGNRTIGAVAADGGSNSNSGVILTIILVQDATGGRTVTWDSSYKWAGGSVPTMTSAANAVDIYRFWCDGSNQAFEISRSMDVK